MLCDIKQPTRCHLIYPLLSLRHVLTAVLLYTIELYNFTSHVSKYNVLERGLALKCVDYEIEIDKN